MPKLPTKVSKGPPRLKAKLNEIIEYLIAVTPRSGAEIWPDFGSGGGVSFRLAPQWAKSGTTAAAAVRFPFQVYQFAAGAAEDWRTVRVWGAGATINSAHADNDDLQGSPLTAVIPASQANYKVWLELTIETADGASQGNVTARTIKHGADPTANGWADYPNQPAGNSTTGAPPNKYFILILDHIVTSNDTLKVLTIPTTQTTMTAQSVVMYGYEIFCAAGNLQMRKRLRNDRA